MANKFLNDYTLCWQNNSTCSKRHIPLEPKGIIIHSTGRDEKYLREYIQPSNEDPQYRELIKLLGRNNRHTDYNHTHRNCGFHFWIGATANGSVQAIATEPLNIKTCNDNYIHICICEDDLTDNRYFDACILCLNALCWRLCQEYMWDSNNIFDHSEVSIGKDISYWLEKFGWKRRS